MIGTRLGPREFTAKRGEGPSTRRPEVLVLTRGSLGAGPSTRRPEVLVLTRGSLGAGPSTRRRRF